jgi:hypothetical protein
LRVIAAIIAALIGLTGAEEAWAQTAYVPSGLELRAGVLAHDVPGLGSGFRLERGVDINAELLAPAWPCWGVGCVPRLAGR